MDHFLKSVGSNVPVASHRERSHSSSAYIFSQLNSVIGNDSVLVFSLHFLKVFLFYALKKPNRFCLLRLGLSCKYDFYSYLFSLLNRLVLSIFFSLQEIKSSFGINLSLPLGNNLYVLVLFVWLLF